MGSMAPTCARVYRLCIVSYEFFYRIPTADAPELALDSKDGKKEPPALPVSHGCCLFIGWPG